MFLEDVGVVGVVFEVLGEGYVEVDGVGLVYGEW